MSFLILIVFLLLPSAHAIECEWWQTKITAHKVSQHERRGNQVSTYGRKEHCRERWPKSDFFIKSIRDRTEPNLDFSIPIKAWKRSESETVLKSLSTIPSVFEMENYQYYRSEKSDHPGNPATIYELSRSIILFDSFFLMPNKDQILVHESGHYLYSKLPMQEKLDFAMISGWTKVIRNKSEIYIPPKNLIKDDSSISQDEEFANHLELYLDDKPTLKAKNPKVFELFEKRFKK